MKSPEVQFTPEDRLILDSYCQMLDGLAQYLGTGYELVLHSLEDLEHSAIRVMNSHTGRSEGAPITELALTMLGRIHAQTQGDTVCYSSTNRDGKPLRSCTIAIRGSEQRIIGLLCINFYMDTPLSQLLETISPAQSQPVAETYVQNSTEMVQAAVQRAAAETDAEGLAGSVLRNREIVSKLYASGIFNIKDAFFERTLKTAEKIRKAVPECVVNVYDIADTAKMTEEIQSSDIFANATIVGMKPMDDQSVVKDLSAFRPGLVVADAVYNPEETKLLREAKEAGCTCIGGKGMLLWQGVAAFKLYTGQDMPVEDVKKLFFS